ncbi:MAG: bifunctional phosphopantothenoylcysteine decarboxylase/phosphopantothenate--cysteine ligase CoaBC [Campylobacterota bacterium]
MLLKNKNILLGITGSIAAYKACDLVRLLVKQGAQVRVVMTPAAQRFVSPLTYEALTRRKVLTQDSEDWASDLNHIDCAKWADLMIVAPATANTINKLSKGIADNLLTQTYLATKAKTIVAPAANTNMIEDANTVASLKMLKVNETAIIEPQNKALACNDIGKGALAEPEDIADAAIRALLSDDYYKDRKVIVTGGGSREQIDDVRFIGNFSSGKMGAALAKALYYRGADVFYLSFVQNEVPKGVHTLFVQDSNEMHDYLIDAVRVAKKGKLSDVTMQSGPRTLIQKRPLLFMAAAVADFTPAFPQQGKLKKDSLGTNWQLELIQTEDILSNIDKEGIDVIGFKAEMDPHTAKQNAQRMLEQKDLEAVCLNTLRSSGDFGSSDNAVDFITKDKSKHLGKTDKLTLAFAILKEAQAL